MQKIDLLIPEKHLQSPITVGSDVVFIDGSYTLTIDKKTNRLEHQPLGKSIDIYVVVATNVPCPTENRHLTLDSLIPYNNCIVRNTNNGDISFCSSVNIRNIKHLGDEQPYRLLPQ